MSEHDFKDLWDKQDTLIYSSFCCYCELLNPGDGHFQLAKLPEKWYIAVYSITGQQVYEQEGEGSSYSSLKPLPMGLYTIKIKSKDNGQETIIKYISM